MLECVLEQNQSLSISLCESFESLQKLIIRQHNNVTTTYAFCVTIYFSSYEFLTEEYNTPKFLTVFLREKSSVFKLKQ